MAPRTKRRLSDVQQETQVKVQPRTKRRLVVENQEPDLSLVPDPQSPEFGLPPLPKWVTSLRPHQWHAVQEIVKHFEDGVNVVFCDAPTGSGKTLIAEMVRRILNTKCLYVCSGKDLQDQFLKDFDYAKVLKGRSNYPTLDHPFPFVTAGDCTKKGSGEEAKCDWCHDCMKCPYDVAKVKAFGADVAVVNTSYLLAEANWVGGFSDQDFIVADECDQLESELMNFVEFNVSEYMLNQLELEAPKKGVHKETIRTWIDDVLIPKIEDELKYVVKEPLDKIKKIRKVNSLKRKLAECELVVDQILDDNWVRDNDAGPLVMKPVRVNDFGRDRLWRHGSKWLCMSATIISSDEMAESLGITAPYSRTGDDADTDEGLRYATVHVPMTFPLEHRRIIASNVGSMSRKNEDATFPKMVDSIHRILERHPDDNVLVHTHSYKLNAALTDALRDTPLLRPIITYRKSADRDVALRKFVSTPHSILLAPSMDRGIDLAGNVCRVVIIAKVPFPYLGDKQVSARLHLPGGQTWYNVQTVRTIVQMTGRAVRSKEDWATTYVLDGEFMRFWKKGKSLLPQWWAESVKVVSPRQLLEGKYEMSKP